MQKIIAISACALILAGCQTGTVKIAELDEKLTRGTPQGYETLTPVDVKFASSTEQFVNNADFNEPPSGVIRLSDGEKSFARLYKLPPWTGVYSIKLSSYMLGNLEDPALFYPRATMLDANFKPTRNTIQKDFTFRTLGERGLISADLWVNEADKRDAYMLVSAEPRAQVSEQINPLQSSGGVPMIVPIGPVILVWRVPVGGTELPKLMKAANAGQVVAIFKPLVTKRIGTD
jgi:hypothetical protein